MDRMNTSAVLSAFRKSTEQVFVLCLVWCAALTLLPGCGTQKESSAGSASTAWVKSWRASNPVWRGVHVMAGNDRNMADLIEALPNLARDGVNVVVLEVDYNFDFQSHPEVRPGAFITKARARAAAEAAHRQGIRLIPQVNCLGHQSW